MLEDLGAVQARIAEIQSRLADFSGQPPQPAAIQSPAFAQTLQHVQGSGAQTSHDSPVSVTPASLGPLPVTPETGNLSALQHAVAGNYDDLAQTYADKYGLPSALVKAVIKTESGGNPHAVSRAGAMGLMQLMPDNVKETGISDPFDPEQNIAAGTKQLSDLLSQYHGDLDLALAGYNAGAGNVRKYGGIPPFSETHNYIRKVKAAMGDSR